MYVRHIRPEPVFSDRVNDEGYALLWAHQRCRVGGAGDTHAIFWRYLLDGHVALLRAMDTHSSVLTILRCVLHISTLRCRLCYIVSHLQGKIVMLYVLIRIYVSPIRSTFMPRSVVPLRLLEPVRYLLLFHIEH